jgi:hypothetical protein
MMNAIRKILAAFCAILFVITAIFALIFFNFDRRAFKAETYKRVLVSQGFYERIPLVLAEAINSASLDESELPFILRGMSTEAWATFFRAMLTQRTLNVMGDEALDSVFAYLNMETNSAQMSLLPLKASMRSEAGVTAVYTLLNGQPDCTLVQLAQMAINLITAQDLQLCKPPEELHPLLTPLIQTQMNVTALALPDQITFASAEGVTPENDPRARLQTGRTLMRLTPLVPLGLLLLLTLLAVNSFKSWLDWWGIPFFLTGIFACIVSLSSAPVISGILKGIIAQRAPTFLPDVFSNYASDLASAMVNALTRPILWQATFLTLIGLIMVITSYAIRQKQKPFHRVN